MKVSEAMLQQLRDLQAGHHANLQLVRALMTRGLVADTKGTRFDLRIHNRMASAYPLTQKGRELLAKADRGEQRR